MGKINENAGAYQAPATLEEATVEILTLTGKLEAAEAELKKSSEVTKSLQSELTDAAEVIEELKSQAASAASGKSKGPIVKIGKTEYLVTGGTVIKQQAFKPEDIAADKQLCEKLIEKGSTLLVKIN